MSLITQDPVVHVIDNDEAIRDALGAFLEACGFAVKVYPSPPSFLAGLEPEARACVVTDVQMPEMSGIDLLKRLKEISPNLPVIVMTGRGGPARRAEAMGAGASAFLEKPFEDEDMLAAVNEALGLAA